MAEVEVEMPNGTILVFPDNMPRADMEIAAASYWSQEAAAGSAPASRMGSAIRQPQHQNTAAGTSQADIAAGLVPSGDIDTRSTGELVGETRKEGFDQAQSLSQPLFQSAEQAWRGATGQGPSVVGSMLQDGVNLGYGDDIEVSPGVANTVGRVADLGLAGLSAVGGVFSGGAGALGDIADDLGVPNADRLGRELAAIPEAFAGSPTQFSGLVPNSARATRFAPDPTSASRGPWDNPTPSGSASRARSRPQTSVRVGRTVRSAGSGNRRAQRRLADQAEVDTAAAEAADRLDIELPADVLSNNQLIKESAGLTRSLAGTPVSAAWRETITRAADKAMEAMQALGGSTDLSSLSNNVLGRLRGTQASLKGQAGKLYDAVDAEVPRGTMIEPANTIRALNEILADLGGEARMSRAERNLFRMATGDQPVTYERLMREKRAVQKALRTGQGLYADADDFLLRRVEQALVQDQLENVQRIGGDGLRRNLELANRLTAQRKDLEGQIVSAFGRDGEGSIANTLRTAVSWASRGDVSNLNRVLRAIPQELRGEAVATALTTLSQSNRASEPGFGFAEFAKVYTGLQRNSQAYRRVIDAIGPQADQTLRDLADISRRISDARANVLTTGKANQALMQGMTAEGLLIRVLNTSLGRNAMRGAAVTTGGATGGPFGASTAIGAGETLMAIVRNRGSTRLEQAGAMFNSPQFRELALKAASGRPTERAQKTLLRSGAFRRWARTNRIQNPVVWLEAALLGAESANPVNEQIDQWVPE